MTLIKLKQNWTSGLRTSVRSRIYRLNYGKCILRDEFPVLLPRDYGFWATPYGVELTDNKQRRQNMNLHKYILYVGLNDKDTKTQKISLLSAREVIQNTIVGQGLDGATISDAIGIYRHDDGTFVTEQSLRVEILFATEEIITTICEQLKTALNQESIAVESQDIESRLM